MPQGKNAWGSSANSRSVINRSADSRSTGSRSSGNRSIGSRMENSRSPNNRLSNGFFQKPAFRPSGIVSLFEQNSRIIDKVRQNPVRNQNRKNNSAYTGQKYRVIDIFSRINNAFFPDSQESPSPDQGQEKEKMPRKKGLLSLALSAIPFTTIFFLVLGIFFLVYSQSSLDWFGRDSSGPGIKDQGSQYNLAVYAGVNPLTSYDSDSGGEDRIPLDLTESFAWQSYKVKRGDSVSKIALDFSVSMDAIIASNGITNARSLREGETLRIPNMDGIPYTVKSGDTLLGISVSMGVPLEAILDANDLQTDLINTGMSLFIPGARMNRDDLKLALGELFVYPVRGAKLSSSFGWRNDPFSGVRSHHAGIDLSISEGTPVRAAMDGTVSAQSSDRIYGNYIIITHSGGYQTLYAHLSATSVRRGDRVLQGTQIGAVGNTGYSTGPHLHFSIYKNSRAVNPLDFLNASR